MTEDMASLPLWMLLFASFGFAIGCALGDEIRHRKNAEERGDELRKHIPHPCPEPPIWPRLLKEQRSILNDIHKQILAVSKGLEKPAPYLRQNQSRIDVVLPFHKLWV
jgi:hypothetical protein